MQDDLQNSNALPMYVQISELLIRDIAAGRLMDGERLAPERDMANSLGISVGTLRKALAILETNQLLERVQGSGNYVRHSGRTDSVYAMFRLELPVGGGLPRADILDVAYVEKPQDLPAFGRTKHGNRIRRLRYLNDICVALEEIWLDGSMGQVDLNLLSDSLYQYYKDQLGFWILRAEDRVSIGAVPDWSPPRFDLPIGQITGYIERLSWSELSIPIEFSRTWFDTNNAHYVQRLK